MRQPTWFPGKAIFRSKLIMTLQNIASQLHTGNDQLGPILLDFSEAFDKVPHQRLQHKLAFYCVR